MQQKLALVTLTVLVSVTMYFSYMLSKKVNTLLKKVFHLEDSLLTIESGSRKQHTINHVVQTPSANEIQMNIVEQVNNESNESNESNENNKNYLMNDKNDEYTDTEDDSENESDNETEIDLASTLTSSFTNTSRNMNLLQ